MKPALFYSIVLTLLMFKINNVFAREQKFSVSKQEAMDECSRTGRTLVNYKELQADPTAPEYVKQLEDGQMAWINGYAELSPFLEWRGCYTLSSVRSLHEFKMTDASLFSCSKVCSPYFDTSYIGIKGRSCYCLNNAGSYMQLVNHTLCNIRCSDDNITFCGGSSYIDLYQLYQWISDLATHKSSKRPCVYLKSTHLYFEAYTASCHTEATGYVCDNFEMYNWKLKAITCNKSFSRYHIDFCFKEKPATRQEAFKDCLNMNGRLVSSEHLNRPLLEAIWKNELPRNITYLLSTYRTIKLSEKMISNETACLAAIKINKVLYVEPDDCSMKKYALCLLDRSSSTASMNFSNSSSSKLTNESTAEYSNELFNVSMEKCSSHISNISAETHFIGYIALSISIFGILLIAGFVIYIKRQFEWLKAEVKPQRANSGSRVYDAQTQNENEADVRSLSLCNLPALNETDQIAESSHPCVGLYEGLDNNTEKNTYEVLG